MGNDGLAGCQNVKDIIEAEESCIVYGMPKVVLRQVLQIVR